MSNTRIMVLVNLSTGKQSIKDIANDFANSITFKARRISNNTSRKGIVDVIAKNGVAYHFKSQLKGESDEDFADTLRGHSASSIFTIGWSDGKIPDVIRASMDMCKRSGS